ncbi:MAG: DUF928 domain-containing protein [Scytolyngbya sp. HA4215-MV1]|nr:DUF928 domain-containing protein [Scytolyngbya sp. HA4215-MV1]
MPARIPLLKDSSAFHWRKFVQINLAVAIGLAVGLAPFVALASYTPPRLGKPGRRVGAGVRGVCMESGRPLMPLVPTNAFGTTVEDQPTLFWYVPPTSAQSAEFTLLDENYKEVYKTTLPLQKVPGIISFQLPAGTMLELQKSYRWQFSLVCDANVPSANPFVEGEIQRVEISQSLTKSLERSPLRDRPEIYAKAGIWHDALSTLAELRCLRPGDPLLTSRWITLLNSVELNDFAAEPLAQYCTQISHR